MNRFYVESGQLQVNIDAADAYDAAVEAVRWWADRYPEGRVNYMDELAEEILVRSQNRDWRSCQRWVTMAIIAHVNQESTEAAWERLLREMVSVN